MKLPIELIHRIQYDYAAEKHRCGVQVFNSLDKSAIEIVAKSLFAWAEEKGYIKDSELDLSVFITD